MILHWRYLRYIGNLSNIDIKFVIDDVAKKWRKRTYLFLIKSVNEILQ